MTHTCNGAKMTHISRLAGMTKTFLGDWITLTFMSTGMTHMHAQVVVLHTHIHWCWNYSNACSGAGITDTYELVLG